MLPPPGLMFDTSGLRDGDGAKPGSTSNRLDFPLASGSPLINAGLFFFFLLGSRQDFFFCQCFSVTEPLSGCCIRPPQRSVGVLRTRRRRNENQRLLCGVFSSWTQSSRCDTHKLLENFKLFGNYSSWRRRGCVVPKNKKCFPGGAPVPRLQRQDRGTCACRWLSSTSNYLLDFNRGK